MSDELLREAPRSESTQPALLTSGPLYLSRWLFFGLAALCLVAVVSYALWRRPDKQETVGAPAAQGTAGTVKFLMEQQWLIRMKLAKAERHLAAPQITATGRVVAAANRQAAVAPPVGGIILRGQLPRVGQRVSAGQDIATLQQTATAAEQAQVQAAAAQAESQNAQVALDAARLDAERRTAEGEITAARARLDLARLEAERAGKLVEQGVLARQQLDTAEATRKQAQADSDAALARRAALEAAAKVTPAGANPGKTGGTYVAQAPISGVVTRVNKNIGEQVAPGEAIVEIVNLDVVWVEAPIFERDLSRLGNKTRAIFTTPAYAAEEFTGNIVNIGAVIDEQTRAATVIFEVRNAAHQLRIGMQADVRLDADEVIDAVAIPKEAVLEHEGKRIVYVLLSGEEFQRRTVTLGDEYGDKVAVLAGLKAGERVVTQGAYQLKLQELRPADAGAHSHET